MKTIHQYLNEALSDNNFYKFESYLENIIPKNKRISLFQEEHRLLIGYFPEYASMGDLSKLLPESVIDKLESKFAGTKFVVMSNFEKPDPISGKKMKFVVISATNKNELQKIEDLF